MTAPANERAAARLDFIAYACMTALILIGVAILANVWRPGIATVVVQAALLIAQFGLYRAADVKRGRR